MPELKDLTGQRFGILAVVSESKERVRGKRSWDCKCDCGNTKAIPTSDLRKAKSCGCLLLKHGHSSGGTVTPEYAAWRSMKKRCFNHNRRDYKDYGGRGITVCSEWDDFNQFLDDMGEKPSPKHSLDRIDVNKGYCKENCRWAIASVQNTNVRSRSNSGYKNISWNKKAQRWKIDIRINKRSKFLGYFTDKKEALDYLNQYIQDNDLFQYGYYLQKWQG